MNSAESKFALPEIWKAIPNTDGMYEISTSGRLRSYLSPRGVSRSYPTILLGRERSKGTTVQFKQVDGKIVERSTARLVAEVFGPPVQQSLARAESAGTGFDKAGLCQSPAPKKKKDDNSFTMVEVKKLPPALRKTPQYHGVYEEILNNFVKSGYKVARITRKGVLHKTVANSLWRARTRTLPRYKNVKVSYSSKHGAYLTREDA
jgi:hypothetical protein